ERQAVRTPSRWWLPAGSGRNAAVTSVPVLADLRLQVRLRPWRRWWTGALLAGRRRRRQRDDGRRGNAGCPDRPEAPVNPQPAATPNETSEAVASPSGEEDRFPECHWLFRKGNKASVGNKNAAKKRF